MRNKFDKLLIWRNIQANYGFGLVDAIVSMTLLVGVITYGIYFASIRLNTVYDSNLTRSITKEIERDIERLKSEFWGMYFNESQREYSLSRSQCEDFSEEIVNLKSWEIDDDPPNPMIQSWRPGSNRSKVFTGQPVLITRELNMKSPIDEESLNASIASVSYRVQWGENNIHWVSIYLSPEAHSWCDSVI